MAWELIRHVSPPSSGELVADGLDLTPYATVRGLVTGLSVLTDDSDIFMRLYLAGALVTSTYRMLVEGRSSFGTNAGDDSTSIAQWPLSRNAAAWGVSSVAHACFVADFFLNDPTAVGLRRQMNFHSSLLSGNDSTAIHVYGGGSVDNTGEITGLKVYGSSQLLRGSLT